MGMSSICGNCANRFNCMIDASAKVQKCIMYKEQQDLSRLIEQIADAIAEKVIQKMKNTVSNVRCKDCENWIPGYITDQDDFIPPKCGKYQQMVGHSADDFCSLAEKQEGGEVG